MNLSQRNKALLILAILVAMAGCAAPPGPYVPKAANPPAIVFCNDNTGHVKGSKPWIGGGTCCCTPTEELMAKLHEDGFCAGMTADNLLDQYEKAGVSLAEKGHQWCNGLCPSAPHVVLGGKCMCPPTPGTQYYEKVVAGEGSPVQTPIPATAPSK
jgi:hypothetical protein